MPLNKDLHFKMANLLLHVFYPMKKYIHTHILTPSFKTLEIHLILHSPVQDRIASPFSKVTPTPHLVLIVFVNVFRLLFHMHISFKKQYY